MNVLILLIIEFSLFSVSKVYASVNCSALFQLEFNNQTKIELENFASTQLGLAFDFNSALKGSATPKYSKRPDYDRRRAENIKYFNALADEIPSDFIRMVSQAVSPIELSDGIIRIQVSSNKGSIVKKDSLVTQFQKKIIHRYSYLYAKIATFVYQLQGLEPKHPITGSRMSNEDLQILTSGSDVEFYVLFDKSVWDTQLRILHSIWQRANINNFELQKDVIAELFDDKIVALPFAGIALVHSKNDSGIFVELKRYWKNNLEDPYGLLSITEKNDFILRHKLLYSVIIDLPHNTNLQIKSHSLAHTRAYKRLGFTKLKTYTDERYPDNPVDLLVSTRENTLTSIIKILSDLKEVDASPPDSFLDVLGGG